MSRSVRLSIRITSLIISGAAVLLLAAPTTAQEPGPLGGPGGPGMLGRALQELSLTDAQRAEIRGTIESSRASSEPLREQLRATRRALRDAMTREVVNESEIRALSAQIAPLEAEAAVQRAHTHAAIVTVLTPDQRDELDALRAEARERIRDRFEQRRQGRRPR